MKNMFWEESRRDSSTAVVCHFTMLFLLLFHSVQLETRLVEPVYSNNTRNNIVKSYLCKFHVCARHFEMTGHLLLIKTSDKTVVVNSNNTWHKNCTMPRPPIICKSSIVLPVEYSPIIHSCYGTLKAKLSCTLNQGTEARLRTVFTYFLTRSLKSKIYWKFKESSVIIQLVQTLQTFCRHLRCVRKVTSRHELLLNFPSNILQEMHKECV